MTCAPACATCGTTTDVLSQSVESFSGPGWTRLICRMCAEIETTPPTCCSACSLPRDGLRLISMEWRATGPSQADWRCPMCVATGRNPVDTVAPTAGLIASLDVRTWLDHTPNAEVFASVLITHPPARRVGESPQAIAQRMLGVAHALGAASPSAELPDVGARVICRHGVVALALDGTDYLLRVPKQAEWAETIANLGQVLVVVGLDPLSAAAHGDQVNEYIAASCHNGRMRFAAARVAVTA